MAPKMYALTCEPKVRMLDVVAVLDPSARAKVRRGGLPPEREMAPRSASCGGQQAKLYPLSSPN